MINDAHVGGAPLCSGRGRALRRPARRGAGHMRAAKGLQARAKGAVTGLL